MSVNSNLYPFKVMVEYSFLKKENAIHIDLFNQLQVEDSDGKYIRESKKTVNENFHINFNNNLIDYRMSESYEVPGYGPHRSSGKYDGKNLTKEEIEKRYGEPFLQRTKELINARNDSLKLINLIKKEYKRWRYVETGNGEIYEINFPTTP